MTNELWDDAFCLIEQHALWERLEDLLEASMAWLVARHRIQTLERWLARAEASGHDPEGASISLARAEVFLRQGQHSKARTYACHTLAAAKLAPSLMMRAHIVAGSAWRLLDSPADAKRHFECARALAHTREHEREALWGLFLIAVDEEPQQGAALFDELSSLGRATPDDTVQLATGRLFLASRVGGLTDALRVTRAAYDLVEGVRGPHIASSFLYMYANALALAGSYARAREVAREQLRYADDFGLTFSRPYAYFNEAVAALGLRDYRSALLALDRVSADITSPGDWLEINQRAVRARLELSRRNANRAVELTQDSLAHDLPPSLETEYAAIHALALAVSGRSSEAQAICEQITPRGVEAAVLLSAADVISRIHDGSDADRSLGNLIEAIRVTGNIDGLVTSYRAFPPLLERLARISEMRSLLRRTVAASNDWRLAGRTGLAVRVDTPSAAGLTPREREVLDLVAIGLANKEIARRLFITEATAKLHVRRILGKLGVRRRTEAAVLAAQFSDDRPPSADQDAAASL